jgi:hypothetical protein
MIHLKKIVYSEYISHPTFPNPMSTMFYNDSEFALWSQNKQKFLGNQKNLEDSNDSKN